MDKKKTDKLAIANKELAFQKEEKEKWAAELILANNELAFQNGEKVKRAAELIITYKELAFQNEEKEKRASELVLANKELVFQNEEKENRASELVIANKELVFQNEEKENRASELVLADKELAFQNEEKEKRAAELVLANKEFNQLNELLQRNLKEISDYKYALDEATIIAVTNENGIIKKANNNFCKISKYSEEELIGQDHRIINSGYHPKEFFRDLWITISKGKIWKGEVKNKAKDGTFYWVDTTIVPFLNERGKPYQYLAIRVDITDRKEAEEYLIQRTNQLGIANKELAFQNDEKENRAAELVIANKELAFQNDEKENRASELVIANKELAFQNEEIEKRSAELIIANKELKKANERFELIGKATNDGLWDWNLETSLVWGNEVHQQMYGLSLADPVPNYEKWKHRIHPEDRERTVKTLEETMASECNICITEYRFFTENTGWMNIYGRSLIERNKEGKPVRLIGSMMDITKNKENEISLIELNENLQKQAKELFISNEDLEGQNQILQDIAWTQSHIVRAPLARMLGIVNIIKDLRVESPDYEKWINHFITSANELDNIIKDIVNKTDTTKLDKF